MSPIIVDKHEKERQIATAALSIFAARGYAATSMNDIAVAAGLAKSTLYEYFATKADIFLAALKLWVEMLEQRMTVLMTEAADPVAKLYTVTQMAVMICDRQEPTLNQFYIVAYEQGIMPGGALSRLKGVGPRISSGILKKLTGVLLEGVAKGAFRPEIAGNVDEIALNMMACVDGILFHNLLSEFNLDVTWHANYYIDNLVAAIAHHPGQ